LPNYRGTRCSENATGAQRGAYSRVCGASTAFRPVAVGVGGAERGAPMSQGAYRRVCGAATPKGAAQRGCSATGPTPRATGSPAALGYAGAGPASGPHGLELGSHGVGWQSVDDIGGRDPTFACHIHAEGNILQPLRAVGIGIDAELYPLLPCIAAQPPIEVEPVGIRIDLDDLPVRRRRVQHLLHVHSVEIGRASCRE